MEGHRPKLCGVVADKAGATGTAVNLGKGAAVPNISNYLLLNTGADMGEDRIRMCECGRHPLPSRRRHCDTCRAESARNRARNSNERAAERKKQGILPPSWRKEYVPKYEQIEVATPWVPKPKPMLVSDAEQARVDEEARQRETEAHQRHMAQFGMVIRKGKPLAGAARKLSAKEIAEVANLYQPPQKADPVLMGFYGEGRE